MATKVQIIQAIKELDWGKLDELLENDKPYMDVPKKLFIARLKSELQNFKDFYPYEEVMEGICDYCNKGCKAYKFTSPTIPALDLFIKEENEIVTDLYLCNNLIIDQPKRNKASISFYFYEDEKVNFQPTTAYSSNLKKIKDALEDCRKKENKGTIKLQDLAIWHDKYKYLAEELELNNPFNQLIYKAYIEIDEIFGEITDLVSIYKSFSIAEQALKAYQQIHVDDEKEIANWLLQFQDNCFLQSKSYQWIEKGILSLEIEPPIIVDCREYLNSFVIAEIYGKHYQHFMEIYKPSKQALGTFGYDTEHTLMNYLKFHKII